MAETIADCLRPWVLAPAVLLALMVAVSVCGVACDLARARLAPKRGAR